MCREFLSETLQHRLWKRGRKIKWQWNYMEQQQQQQHPNMWMCSSSSSCQCAKRAPACRRWASTSDRVRLKALSTPSSKLFLMLFQKSLLLWLLQWHTPTSCHISHWTHTDTCINAAWNVIYLQLIEALTLSLCSLNFLVVTRVSTSKFKFQQTHVCWR